MISKRRSYTSVYKKKPIIESENLKINISPENYYTVRLS